MKKFQMPIRYDTSNINKEYCIEVSNKFEALNATTEEMRPKELANRAKEIFTEASKHLKTKQQKKQKMAIKRGTIKDARKENGKE